MLRIRVLPCLLLKDKGLVKTVKFKDPKYLGDPINTIKIFNEKEVDELVLLDIDATIKNQAPDMGMISAVASECFMPLAYGGGIRNIDDIRQILSLGVEKVIINSYAIENPDFIKAAFDKFGSQSIVVSIDVKKNIFGRYEIYSHGGKRATKIEPASFAVKMQNLGAGEILLNSIDRDGTMKGYDIEIINRVSHSIQIPLVACGGAGNIKDFKDAVIRGGASAVSAGSYFVFQGPHRAVLISYPKPEELEFGDWLFYIICKFNLSFQAKEEMCQLWNYSMFIENE